METLQETIKSIKIPSQFEIIYKDNAFQNMEEAKNYANSLGLKYAYHMLGISQKNEHYISTHRCDNHREDVACNYFNRLENEKIQSASPSLKSAQEAKKLHQALENAWKASIDFVGGENNKYQKDLRELLDFYQDTP